MTSNQARPTRPQNTPGYRKGAKLDVQAERVCPVCTETFGSLRPSHRYCSPPCKQEAHLLIKALEGRSTKYASLPDRLAAATPSRITPVGKMLDAFEAKYADRVHRRSTGEITPQERGALAVREQRERAARDA